MAHSTNRTAVSDSLVYRNWQRIQNKPTSYGAAESVEESNNCANRIHHNSFNNNSDLAPDNSSWTFLQRLLAIEEAHDRKKMASTRHLSKKHKIQHGDSEVENRRDNPAEDMHFRWTYEQILDDPGTPDSGKTPERGRRTSSLPPIANTKTTDPYMQVTPLTESVHTTKLPSLPSDKLSLQGGLSQSQTSLRTIPSTHGPPASRQTSTVDDDPLNPRPRRKRPLRLPPILLPRVYAIKPRPLQCREFLTPTKVRGPITEAEWEDLKDCRYIRHAVPRYSLQVSSSNLASLS